MASSMPKPVAAKQLGELLQEQQEPFILEAYLLERGYRRNKSNSEASFRCSSSNSSSFLKRSASWGLNKRRKVIPNYSKIVKAVFNKLVFSTSNKKVKKSASGDGNSSVREIGRHNQETAESDGFFSASSMTVINSCSDSDMEDGPNSSRKDSISATAESCIAFRLGNLLQGKEVVTERELQWRCREDNKELSPVSVLEEIPSSEDSPDHDNRQRNAKTRDSCTGATASQGLARPDPSSQHLTAKWVLQQSKQLLFDCVREIVETCAWKDRQQKSLEFLGRKELAKLLCEDMRTWSKLSRRETNTTRLLNSDFTASVSEWSDFESQRREIAAEIGDAIFEDISKEIALDMIELVEPHLSPAT